MTISNVKIGNGERGSTLLIALSTILVLSIAGATVLMNSTTRYNATSKQVKGWKEALYAAEAGGDIAFAKVRKWGVLDPTTADPATVFTSADGWAAPAPSPLPVNDPTSGLPISWNLGYTNSPPTFGENNSLRAKVTVDRFALLPGSNPTVGYFRIRSLGTATVTGLKRVGMDDRMDSSTKGDSLLRRVDFNVEHFISTFGYGDALATAAPTTANGKASVAVADPNRAQVTRRIELIAVPVMPIEGAVKTSGAFHGTTVDSYDSKNGDYKGSNPASPYDVDAHDGDVVVGGSSFSAGHIYGDVTTNGGNATTNNVSGVVDNNVPIAVPTATPGVNPIPLMPGMMGGPTPEAGSPNTINPPIRRSANGTLQTTFWYNYTDVSGVTINPLQAANGTPIDTTVNIYATGDVSRLTVNAGVSANIYFRGNMSGKARDFDNFNVNGPVVPWQWFYTSAAARTGATGFVAADIGKIAYQDGNPGSYWQLTATTPSWVSYTSAAPFRANSDVSCAFVKTSLPLVNGAVTAYANAAARSGAAGFAAGDVGKLAYQSDTQAYYQLATTAPTWTLVQPYSASTLVSKAGHVWFYGLSPADGSTRTIDIGPPGTMYAAFYAPSYDFSSNGNPDFFGVGVFKSFSQNGNCTFHFDKELASGSIPLDYRIASFVEDIR